MTKSVFIFLLLLPILSFGFSAFTADADFQVIVNASNPVDSIDQKYLADIFLKKRVFWPDRRVIVAVDLNPYSQVRRQFSVKVLDRPVSAVRNYWQQLLFSGRAIPPPEFRTEQEVIDFVSSHEDAIGYVSPKTETRGLKVLTIIK